MGKVPALNTGDSSRRCGFESCLCRQPQDNILRPLFFISSFSFFAPVQRDLPSQHLLFAENLPGIRFGLDPVFYSESSDKRFIKAYCHTRGDCTVKIQVAYDTLAAFLEQNRAGLAEEEALKTLASYAKGVETRTLRSQRPPVSYGRPTGAYTPSPVPRTPAPRVPSAGGSNNIARGIPWSDAEDAQLRGEFASGFSASAMATNHGRTIEAIAARLVRLHCINDREDLPGYIEYRQTVARLKGGTYTPKAQREKKA